MAIQHVSIGVHDLDASIEFFGWLGLTIVPNRPNFGVGGAWLQAAGQQVHLIVTDKPTPGLENHFAFVVDDLDSALAELDGKGVVAFRTSHVPGAGRQGFINDPSGNVIELNQPD
jgi:catechol 2,3-dioxygenase-like lactoylglutathione lyase family enzyme